MKNYTLVFAREHKSTFDSIKDGSKRIETRAATTKYRDIKAGDILTMSCQGEKFEKKVKNVFHFKSLEDLFSKFEPNQIKPGVKSTEEMTKIYYSFPHYEEKIAKDGILAFELE